jgi:hypothetical protein
MDIIITNNCRALLQCIACADRSNAPLETFDYRPVAVRCARSARIFRNVFVLVISAAWNGLRASCGLPHQLFGRSYTSLTTSRRVHRSFGRPTSTWRKTVGRLRAHFATISRDTGVGWAFKRFRNYFPSSLPVGLNLSRAHHRGMPGERVFPAVHASRVDRAKPPWAARINRSVTIPV